MSSVLSDESLRQTLRQNGFPSDEYWLDFARNHSFRDVTSERVESCPGCGSAVNQNCKHVAQYVYYSTLIALIECEQCGLIYGDRRISAQTVQQHFDLGYKDDQYFQESRTGVFKQLAELVDKNTPHGGRVLDIGGAKGHLLNIIGTARPDLLLTLNDLSEAACNYAAQTFSLDIICGGLEALSNLEKFDTIILSDVIYYEPQLERLWNVLKKISTPDTTIVIRVPNKLLMILAYQRMSAFVSEDFRTHQHKIRFFNPEHLYLMSRSYLRRALERIGFNEVSFLPATPLRSPKVPLLSTGIDVFCKFIWLMSGKRLLLSPSQILLAKRRGR